MELERLITVDTADGSFRVEWTVDTPDGPPDGSGHYATEITFGLGSATPRRSAASRSGRTVNAAQPKTTRSRRPPAYACRMMYEGSRWNSTSHR